MNNVLRRLKDIKKNNPQSKILLGVLLVFMASCGFSSKAIMIKLLYRHGIDTISVQMLRMLFSLPFFTVVAIGLPQNSTKKSLSRTDLLTVAGLGLLGYHLSSFLDFMGLQYVTASVERMILFIYPTFVVLFSALFFGKKISKDQLLALLLTYAGVACAFFDNLNVAVQKNLWLGAAYIFVCAITYAWYLIGSERAIPRIGSVVFTCYAMLFATLGAFVQYGLTHKIGQLFRFEPIVYGIALLMAIFATVLPSFMVSEGIRLMGSNNTAIVASVGPLVTIVLGYFILGEPVSQMQLMGTFLVIVGVLMITVQKPKA